MRQLIERPMNTSGYCAVTRFRFIPDKYRNLRFISLTARFDPE